MLITSLDPARRRLPHPLCLRIRKTGKRACYFTSKLVKHASLFVLFSPRLTKYGSPSSMESFPPTTEARTASIESLTRSESDTARESPKGSESTQESPKEGMKSEDETDEEIKKDDEEDKK